MTKYSKLKDFDLLSFGLEIQLYGGVYAGKGKFIICPFPDEDPKLFDQCGATILELSAEEWHQVIQQTDFLNVEMPDKAIVRKSQRQIDSKVAWEVYRRDGYRCRYCGRDDVPLTVDHADTWESGGVSLPINLVSSCRPCNKERGDMPYPEWLASRAYGIRAKRLSPEVLQQNADLLAKLPEIEKLRVKHQRSR